MYLMFGDEADKDPTAGKKFFVYGAIFAPTNSIASLHSELEKARKVVGLADTDSLKSASGSRPKAMTAEKHREVKNAVMKVAQAANVKFCAQVTLHDLARNQDKKDLITFGANTIIAKFNTFLGENKSHGYVILDRLPVPDPYTYLKQKFQTGMVFPGKPSVRFDRVLGFAHGVDGSSHMCSVADVLLGAFRYCVNEPDNEEANKAMFPTLMSMMWKREAGGKIYVRECGLLFRPLNIQEPKHRAEYDALSERLQSYLA
jgi:hypothetical protein